MQNTGKIILIIIVILLIIFLTLLPKKDNSDDLVTPPMGVELPDDDDTDDQTPIDREDLLIFVDNPVEGQEVGTTFEITGEARGQWYFEATFPIVLTDWDGRVIAESFATADGEWMTTNFVPFTAEITYDPSEIEDAPSDRGTLILQKSNPSGLPENDQAIEIVVSLER